jgi:hypothetical protein
MTNAEVKNSTFVFDSGEKKIGDCTVDELYHIIGYQQETLLKAQAVLHQQHNLLKMRRH